MSAFLLGLFSVSLSMSAVMVLLLILNVKLRGKISASFRYCMWLIVIVGLLIPFRPSVPVVFAELHVPHIFKVADLSSSSSDAVSAEVKKNTSIGQGEPGNAIGEPSTSQTSPTPEKTSIPIAPILFGLWAVGAMVILAFHFLSYARFTSIVRRWGVKVDDERLLSVFRMAQADMGLQRISVAIKTCVIVSSPMLIGFFKPVILLPERELSQDDLDYAFRHELTHYKRKDLWANLLVLLATAVHWFNPLVYLVARAIRVECETACDDAVVNGYDTERRKQYGETIIGFIGTNKTRTPVLSTYFFGGTKTMKKRLFAIMDTSRRSKGLAVASFSAVVMASIVLGSAIAISATPDTMDNNTVPVQLQQGLVSDNTEQNISEAKAKSIALSAAGLLESQIHRLRVKLYHENGKTLYEVEFYLGAVEYEYTIDAKSGDILELEIEDENGRTVFSSRQQEDAEISRR